MDFISISFGMSFLFFVLFCNLNPDSYTKHLYYSGGTLQALWIKVLQCYDDEH